jgi:glycosyl transferase family 25
LQLENLQMPFEFVIGVDGRKLTETQLNLFFDEKKCNKYYWRKQGKNRGMIRGEIGCALSHKLIYTKMIQENIQRAVILEDDVIISKDFFEIIDFLENLKINNYLIKLDTGNLGKNDNFQAVPWHKVFINSQYKICHPISPLTLAWGYYIDIKAAAKMLDLTRKIFVVADEFDYFKNHVKLRLLNKAVVFNADFESVINNAVEEQAGQKYYNIRFGGSIKKFNRIIRKACHIFNVINSLFH